MKKNKTPKVIIVILNWNNWQDTIECLESVNKSEYRNFEVIVVDNGSTNNSVQKIKNKFNTMILLETGENLGFSAGVNYGLKFAINNHADLILLLNNDAIVSKTAVTELVKRISRDERVGLIGGKILFLEDKHKIWSAGGRIKKTTKRTYQFGEGRYDDGKYNTEREVDFLSACCLLIRKEVIEQIGWYDPDYFMYYEDVDFCVRAKQYSYKIVYWPQAVIWHKVGGASNKSLMDYYRMRNYLLFLKKRYSYPQISIRLLGTYIFVERLLRIFVRKIIYRDRERILNRLSALIKGFKAGLAISLKCIII